MNNQDIYDFLKEKGIRYKVTEHEAVFSMEELDKADMPNKDCLAKNLFVRDDKKENYYLITVKGRETCGPQGVQKDFRVEAPLLRPEGGSAGISRSTSRVGVALRPTER